MRAPSSVVKALRLFAALLLAFAIVPMSVVTASAHTPRVSHDCEELSVTLTNYNPHETNTVMVTIDDEVVLQPTAFVTSYSNTFAFGDSTLPHSYVVEVFAGDDEDGDEGWTKTFSGTSTPCEAPEVEKVTLCHATPPDTAAEGWNKITVSESAVVTEGHGEHGLDVIPPFEHDGTSYEGKNWDEVPGSGGMTGQEFLDVDCPLPEQGETPVEPEEPTVECATGGVNVVLPHTEHLTYTVEGHNGTFVPVAEGAGYEIVVTVTAEDDYEIDGPGSYTLTGVRDCEQPPPPCVDGLLPLDDFTFVIGNDTYTTDDNRSGAEKVTSAWHGGDLSSPLLSTVVFYDPDHDGDEDDAPAGCSRGFQLEAFATDGPSWSTSGTQVWDNGDGDTIDDDTSTIELTVTEPPCYYQTDLSSQDKQFGSDDYFDGHDAGHPVPHYPNVGTPHHLIAASNGGDECEQGDIPIRPEEPTVVCAEGGVRVVLPDTDHLTYDVVGHQGTFVPVAEGADYTIVVTVTADDDYEIDGPDSYTLEGTRDCLDDATPVAPSVSDECAEGGVEIAIPTTAGVDYMVGDEVVTGTVLVAVAEDEVWSFTVTPAAQEGFELTSEEPLTIDGTRDCEVPAEEPKATSTAPSVVCATGGLDVVFPTDTPNVTYDVQGVDGTFVTVAEGASFSIRVTVAADEGYTLEGPAEYTLTGTRDCETAPTVTPPDDETRVLGTRFAAGGTRVLARTGDELALFGGIGSILLLAGAVVMVATRRKEA